ncbi:MAG TPA: YdcH family protein [Alphaproteobacteria bacterium]|nr:YdcH family protein [Alphaproteobacteria bacterium]
MDRAGAPLAGVGASQTGELTMAVETDVSALKTRHAGLDRMILEEQRRRVPNEFEIKRMKLEKLYLKEEIDRLSKARPH